MHFLPQLHSNLAKHGFNPGHTNDNSQAFASFTKEDGSSWYVLLVVDMSSIGFDDFLTLSRKYTHFYTNLSNHRKPKNIYITNLIVTPDDNQRVKHFIHSLPPFVKDDVNNIYWSVDLSSGQLFLNKHHPSQVLNLRSIVIDSYQNRVSGMIDTSLRSATQHTPLTLLVIIVNVMVFAIVHLNGGFDTINLIQFGALFPYLVFEQGQIWRLFTSMFLHGSMTHLFVNMFSLYIFARLVERFYSRGAFVAIFMISGITGGLFSLFLSRTVSVGASGMIFGMSAAVAVLAKLSRSTLDGLNYNSLLVFITINLLSGFVIENVDNWGHIGGLVGGAITSYLICKLRARHESSSPAD